MTKTPDCRYCRCKHCGKLLGKNLTGTIEIKCTRCKTVNHIGGNQ